MYTTGSSSFNNQHKQRIVSPSLRVTVREGLNISKEGSGVNTFSIAMKLGPGAVYCSKLLPFNIRYEYSTIGSTILGQSVFNHSIFKNGSTLVLYQSNFAQSGTSRYNLFSKTIIALAGTSINGITVGASVGILNGSTVRFTDVVAVSESQLYATAFNNVFGLEPGSSLYSLRKYDIYSIINGGSWVVRKIYSGNYYQNDDNVNYGGVTTARKSIQAVKVGNLDRIMHIGGRDNCGEGLHVIETDGINIFRDEEIIDTKSQFNREIWFHDLVNVSNVYYLPIHIRDLKYINYYHKNYSPIRLKTAYNYGHFLMSSKDFINWSTPKQFTQGLTYQFLLRTNQEFSTLEGNASIFTDTRTLFACRPALYNDVYTFNKGSTSLDVSDNIISMTNTNNERISLTLGNMK